MGNRIGITGSRGVIGNLLVKELILRNIQFAEYNSDIRDTDLFFDWIEKNELTSIIHLASKVAIKEVLGNVSEAYDVNVNGTIQIIKAIQKYNKPIYFFYASSSHVYKSSSLPISESFDVSPLNTYGLSKYLSEQLLIDFSKSNVFFSLCIGRIFSFYHGTQSEPYLYPTIKRRLESEDLSKPFLLMGANSVRDFLNAEEVSNIITELHIKEATGIINIGSGVGVSIKNFVSSLTNEIIEFEIPEDDICNSLVADVTKLKTILGNDK